MWKIFKSFTKFGIVIFVLLSAWAGYALGHSVETPFNFWNFLFFTIGCFLISAGSLGLNQVQEADKDALMPRTQKRPIPSGQIGRDQGLILSGLLIFSGLVSLLLFNGALVFLIGLFIILLYNGPYTLYWKPQWVFAAVPGAVPGALPVVLGFAAVNSNLLEQANIYLFLLLFLWQMPHFWALAIKFKDDYAMADFPTLPVALGTKRTLYHISFYVMSYCLLALMSPLFVDFGYAYFIFVLPFAGWVFYEFLLFHKNYENAKAWPRFFLSTTFSIIPFLYAPVIDRYLPFLLHI